MKHRKVKLLLESETYLRSAFGYDKEQGHGVRRGGGPGRTPTPRARVLTTDGGVLLQVLAAHVDVLHQALPRVRAPLLHGVFRAKGTDGHVLQGEP